MKYVIFDGVPKDEYPIVILSPTITERTFRNVYLKDDIPSGDVLGLTLYLREDGKVTAKQIDQYLDEQIYPTLEKYEVRYLLVAHGEYFKRLTGVSKVNPYKGYVLDTKKGGYKAIYLPSINRALYQADLAEEEIELAVEALISHIKGTYVVPGTNIIKTAVYPSSVSQIASELEKLHKYPALAIDIETFSLKHPDAGIGSIAFAWNQHEGISFQVDPYDKSRNLEVRALLREFFEKYEGKRIYHGSSFDVTVLIYQLYMKDLLDYDGLLKGLEIFSRDLEDTLLIKYLATNSCSGNELGLKESAQEFAGNYAQEDIADITKIPVKELLEYNLVDTLSTWFTYNKYYPIMCEEEQLDLYTDKFIPFQLDIIHSQLVGMPVNMETVLENELKLILASKTAFHEVSTSTYVKDCNEILRQKHVEKRNAVLKSKRISMTDKETQDVVFNPRSYEDLSLLLYEVLSLPVIETTDSGNPSTSGDTLKDLKNHTNDKAVVKLLDDILEYLAISKILSTFIPALKSAYKAPDGWHYLYGNFRLGGTVSGRLSSNSPNLQQIPAGGKLGNLIKECFEAPPGKLFVGLDFSSLEDRISALTTRDPNKLVTYVKGFDGHSFRTYSYWPEALPDIDPNSVESINSIRSKYPELRDRSKAPTFLKTYGGTYYGLIKKCGFSPEEARRIDENYHRLYKVSDEWVKKKIEQASIDGYVVGAFGLRVRTPLLKRSIIGNRATPREAEAEARTAGNALGQSWCLLNNRAFNETIQKTLDSRFRGKIRPCAQIHDATYYIIDDDADTVLFLNKTLVKASEWQEDPAIYHPEVGLGGELSIFYPNWSKEIELPNNCSKEQLFKLVQENT